MNILYNYSHAIFTAKRFIACVLVLLLLLNCAPRLTHYREYGLKLPLTISHRVGDVVDAAERLEFDLLRGIDDFVYAEYYAIFDGGYEVAITTDDAVYRAVNRDKNAVRILCDYIERYEEILDDRASFEKQYGIVAYDVLGQPITSSEIDVVKPLHPAAASGTLTGVIMFVPAVIAGLYTCGFNWDDGCTRSGVLGMLTFVTVFGGSIWVGSAGGDRIAKERALEGIIEARRPYRVE